jgi:hypothetical protein
VSVFLEETKTFVSPNYKPYVHPVINFYL